MSLFNLCSCPWRHLQFLSLRLWASSAFQSFLTAVWGFLSKGCLISPRMAEGAHSQHFIKSRSFLGEKEKHLDSLLSQHFPPANRECRVPVTLCWVFVEAAHHVFLNNISVIQSVLLLLWVYWFRHTLYNQLGVLGNVVSAAIFFEERERETHTKRLISESD